MMGGKTMTQKNINTKRAYEKPSMKVYELPRRAQLLVGSDSDNWGYSPTISEDMNQMA